MGIAVALALASAVLVASLLPVGRPSAHAAGGSAIFYGLVLHDRSGALPTKVRALGAASPGGDTAVCGTTDVIPTGTGTGFYVLSVVSGETHVGCPAPGGEVRFLLLYGAVDPGTSAEQVATWEIGAQQLNLSPVSETVKIGGFTGVLPSGPGYGLLTWDGADAVPIAQALSTIPRDVSVAFRISGGSVDRYIAGAPDFASTLHELNRGDIIIVLVK